MESANEACDCGADHREGERFCSQCGSRLETPELTAEEQASRGDSSTVDGVLPGPPSPTTSEAYAAKPGAGTSPRIWMLVGVAVVLALIWGITALGNNASNKLRDVGNTIESDGDSVVTESRPTGFPDESDEELIQACMRGGSNRANCTTILPLVRAQDANGNGIADSDE
jgi:hypothetical protein